MELVIFHYHLLPGGVTGVIERSIRAVTSYTTRFDRIRVVTSQQPKRFELPDNVSLELMPSIGYTSTQRLAELAPDDGDGRSETEASTAVPAGRVSNRDVAVGAEVLARQIEEESLQRFGGNDSVWWIHNHHLGKNPAFTKAVVEIAASHPTQPIVLHIHDFPECGRYDNLRCLESAGVVDRYPRGPHVTYVTLNSRDRQILIDAGIDDAVYLPNPVSVAEAPQPAKHGASTRTRLFDAYGVEFPRFDPAARLFLYPVRSIRRKNVFEAALLTMLREEPSALVVSLPGVSHGEKQYSAMVENAFHDGTIPGLFGIGATIESHGVSFSDLLETADAIVSSSVQEGFGYQYISPLLLGKPLAARRLDIMDDLLPLFADHPHAFYTSLTTPIPAPSLSGPQALLRFRYEERIDRLAISLPAAVKEELYRALDGVLGPSTVEFSFLLPHMQYVILQDIRRDGEYRQAFRRANTTVIDEIERAVATPAAATPTPARSVSPSLNAFPPPKASLLDATFGLSAHAANVSSIIDQVRVAGEIPRIDSAKILQRFATLEYQRLLYE